MDNYEIPFRNLDLVINKDGEYVLVFWNNDKTAFKEVLTDEIHQVKVTNIEQSQGFTPRKKESKDFFVPNYCIEKKCSYTDCLENVNPNLYSDMGAFMSIGYEHKLAEIISENEIKPFKDFADRFIENNKRDIEEFDNYKIENGWSFVGGFAQQENAWEASYFKMLSTSGSYNVIMDQFMQKAKTIAKELNNGEFDADLMINGATDLETLKSIAEKGLGKYAYLKKEKNLEVSEEKLEENTLQIKKKTEKYESLNL